MVFTHIQLLQIISHTEHDIHYHLNNKDHFFIILILVWIKQLNIWDEVLHKFAGCLGNNYIRNWIANFECQKCSSNCKVVYARVNVWKTMMFFVISWVTRVQFKTRRRFISIWRKIKLALIKWSTGWLEWRCFNAWDALKNSFAWSLQSKRWLAWRSIDLFIQKRKNQAVQREIAH